MKILITLLRPHQWLKNLFIFLPLFFGELLTDWHCLYFSLLVFFAFSFAASSIYCFNDIWDVEADKLHPKKCKRPIASGCVSKRIAYLLMLLCVVLSIIVLSFCGKERFYPLLATIGLYFLMNIAYCVKLKHFALIDVIIISLGFVLRIFAGGIATGVFISQWIVLMTFLLALFLAFAKRRDDVVIYEETGVKARGNINRYNLEFMNQAVSIVAAITMVCYIMYTVSDEVVTRLGTTYLYGTSVFVLAGILRYLQLTIVDVKSGSPTQVLMKDRFIQFCVIGWLIVFGIIIYC